MHVRKATERERESGEREREGREGRQCKEGRVSVKKTEREIIYNPDAQSACKL